MPFGLGFFAAAGAGGAAGSYDLLETQTLTGSQASVTFNSLSSYASAGYQHLQIRHVARSTTDGATIFCQFNADTTASYTSHRLLGNGSAASSDAFTGTGYLFAGVLMYTNGGVASAFGASVMDILDPFETTKFKTTKTFAGVPGGPNYLTIQSGSWRNTNALTSIKLYANLGDLAQYSRFSLYGLKAA